MRLFFVCVLVLFEKTVIGRDKRTFELKIVKNITEILSREDGTKQGLDQDQVEFNLNDLLENESTQMCKKGFKTIEHSHVVKQIEFFDKGQVEESKKYLVETREKKGTVSFEVLPALKCPSEPATYINVRKYDDKTRNMELLAIVKKNDPHPRLSSIKGYEIKLLKNIREAFVEDITLQYASKIKTSLFDTDELTEEPLLQMCRKAVNAFSEIHINVSREENPHAGRNKYYVLSEESEIDDEDSSTMENTDVRGIMQAFECPTYPKLYLHVSDEEHSGRTMWIFLTADTKYPAFEIMGYQLRVLFDIVEVSPNELKRMKRENSSNIRESTIKFDSLAPLERLQMCHQAILVTMGGTVSLSKDTDIGPSKFRALRTVKDSTIHDEIVAAICCPTTNEFLPVYIHVSDREDGGKVLWVLVKRNADFDRLPIWVEN